MAKKSVLCVGLVCIDIIQVCKSFPIEDSDQRCLECYWQRGGNASNNCTILSELGTLNHFFGTVSDSMFSKFVFDDFKKHHIDISHAVMRHGVEFPFSSVIINKENGSRTIIHANMGWPEPTLEDLKLLDLQLYSWIHFEGRNVIEVQKMMSYISENRADVRISVELEKPKKDLFNLTQEADVVFIGRDFALHNNWHNMDQAIDSMKEHVKPSAIVICTWGDKGAIAVQNECISKSPGYPPDEVVDSLGAGDTFCAVMIHCLRQNIPLERALEISCRLAGAKVGIKGYSGIGQIYNNIVNGV